MASGPAERCEVDKYLSDAELLHDFCGHLRPSFTRNATTDSQCRLTSSSPDVAPASPALLMLPLALMYAHEQVIDTVMRGSHVSCSSDFHSFYMI